MNSHVAWANDTKVIDGQREEHVSFASFVKNFKIKDKSEAMKYYDNLLKSERIKKARRESLLDSYTHFVGSRLDSFWAALEQKALLAQTQTKLDRHFAIVAKETAIIAQDASLHETAKSSAVLQSEAIMKPAVSATTSVTMSSTAAEMSTSLKEVDNRESEADASEIDSTHTTEDFRSSPEPTIAVPPPGAGLSPFHDLILYAFQRAKGRAAILPTAAPSELSRLHQEMYMAALEELRKPGDVVSKKDMMVLLSTVINTLSTSGRRFSISRRIMKASLIPELTPDLCKPVKSLLRELLLALHPQIDHDRQCPPDFRQLKRMVWRLLLDTTEKTESYTTLQIVNQILHWIELGMFAPPTSEHVYVSAWSLLFNTLLLDTNIRAIPGELVSKASTSARQHTETTFGSTALTSCGRKVDMSIRIHMDNHWKSEIAIFEFKTSTASPETIRKQQKKSVRLNAAILLDLEWQGLNISRSYPIIAEGQALGLSFYTLRRYDDVLGAGKATAKGISLPSQVEHLKAFLESDAILTLLAFKEHLRRYAVDVTDMLAISSSTPFDSDTDDSYEDPPLTDPFGRPSTPPPKKRARPFVVFSPSKRDKKGSQFQNDLECDDDEAL